MRQINSILLSGVVDDSGIRLLYTTRLRENEAAVLTLGHEVSHQMVIPPGQTWKTVGRCGSPCLEEVSESSRMTVTNYVSCLLQQCMLQSRCVGLKRSVLS